MISIIMPTLWKPDSILDTLNHLSQNSKVGEIILIDNDPNNGIPLPEIPKIIHIKESENTFVNPAWNKGVEIAKYDKILLLNDDVISDWSILDLIYDSITEDVGIIGPAASCWRDQEENVSPYLQETQHMVNCYGCVMFFHKKSYTKIPEGLKVHYGDNWIFENSGKPNFMLYGWRFSGESEQTSGLSMFNEIKHQDSINYSKLK